MRAATKRGEWPIRGRWWTARESWLFIALGGALLIPIWSALFIPTQDGASHLYNARILSDLLFADSTPFADAYRTNL
jgi:hypothetical protein